MTEYLHHVPGRIRIKARLFRVDTPSRSRLLRTLRGREGVRDVRLNAKAGSVTVYYDTAAVNRDSLLEFLNRECAAAVPASRPAAAVRQRAPAAAATPLTSEIGRMALSVLVSKGVNFSLSSLLGARI